MCFSSSRCLWQRYQVPYPCWPQWELLMALAAASVGSALECIFTSKAWASVCFFCEPQRLFSIILQSCLKNHSRGTWGGYDYIRHLYSSSISCRFFHFSISAFSVSSSPSCLSVSCLFQPHFSFRVVVLRTRGLVSLHGTTAYQRHSREGGEVTSVSWRYKVLQCFLRTSRAAPLFFLNKPKPNTAERPGEYGGYWAENIKCWPVGENFYVCECALTFFFGWRGKNLPTQSVHIHCIYKTYVIAITFTSHSSPSRPYAVNVNFMYHFSTAFKTVAALQTDSTYGRGHYANNS